MIKIAPSILSADFCRLKDEVEAVEAAGADWLHLDVMDGHFVPNLTIGPPVVESLRKVTRLPLDTHLMIENPEKYVDAFAAAGSDLISVHAEACDDLPAIFRQIRAAKVRPAVVINPATELERVAAVLGEVDLLLIMSVHPGFGGQKFIESAVDKIAAADRLRRERNLSFLIEVDGGIKADTAGRVGAAGADVLVSGSGVFGKGDYREKIETLRQEATAARRARLERSEG